MRDFVDFLCSRCYKNYAHEISNNDIERAIEDCVLDVRYHFRDISRGEVLNRIMYNQSELAIFLYRLARAIYNRYPTALVLNNLHWLMKECCSCEIYYSTDIGVGFYVGHGVGTVVGSRNKIGKGFKIYQGCTIGHTLKQRRGAIVGDNVVLFANAQIIGDVIVGNNVVIASHSVVLEDVPDNSLCTGIPATIKPR